MVGFAEGRGRVCGDRVLGVHELAIYASCGPVAITLPRALLYCLQRKTVSPFCEILPLRLSAGAMKFALLIMLAAEPRWLLFFTCIQWYLFDIYTERYRKSPTLVSKMQGHKIFSVVIQLPNDILCINIKHTFRLQGNIRSQMSIFHFLIHFICQ